MSKKEFKDLVNEDPNRCNLPSYSESVPNNDPNHLERRRDQRAISHEMIDVALMYGMKQRSHGAVTYNLPDRVLVNTPYKRYLSELRGLTVVAYSEGDSLDIITTYWNESIIKRKRY